MKLLSRLAAGIGPLLLLGAAPPPPTCEAYFAKLSDFASDPKTRIEAIPGGCALNNAHLPIGSRQRVTVDRLTVTGPDLLRAAAEHRLPVALTLEAHGLRIVPVIDNRTIAYIVKVQQRPFDGRLRYEWDKAGKQFHLRELSVQSERMGRLSLAVDADLDDIRKLNRDTPAQAAEGLGLRRIRIDFDNKAIMEGFLVAPLVTALGPVDDPEVAVEARKAKLVQQIAALAASVADAGAKQALTGFVKDFPHPTGHFEVELNYDKPLRLDTAHDLKALDGNEWQKEARIAARYVPTAP
jgi:hypothetical protein